jgi:hypothetical protein
MESMDNITALGKTGVQSCSKTVNGKTYGKLRLEQRPCDEFLGAPINITYIVG